MRAGFSHRLVALRRRKKLIAAVLVVGVPVAVVIAFLQQPIYVATSKLLIQKSPEVMDLGADFMPRGVGRVNPLARAEAIVLSDRVLGRVVDAMERPVETGDPNSLYRRARALARRALVHLGLKAPLGEPVDPQPIRQAQIDGVRGSLKIDADGPGSVLSVSAYAPSPGQASWTANKIAEAFVSYEREERRDASQAALLWLAEKMPELRERIRRKEENRDALGARLGPVSKDASQTEATRAKLLSDLEAVRLELFATNQRLAQLLPLVERASPEDASQRRELRGQRETSRAALETARLRYTETHPEVRRLRAVVAALEKQLGADGTPEQRPLGEDRILEFRQLEAERGQLSARESAVRSALAKLGGGEEADRDLMAQFDRLEREVTIDREMLSVLMKRQNETILHAANQTPLARVLDYAVPPLNPEPLRRLLYLAVGVLAVVGLAVGAAIGLELLDPAIYDPDAVADMLEAPLLQQIPLAHSDRPPELQSDPESQTLVAEAFRNLRTSILFTVGTQRLQSLLVTSSVAGEGKTTCSVNLAATFAQTGRRVIVVDADLRRPRQHKVLGLDREPGLAEVLSGDRKASEVICKVEGQPFDCITAGRAVSNPVDLLGAREFDRALAQLSETYDLVIFDAPVLLAVADALMLASRVDGVLFISKPGKVDRHALKRVRQDLVRAKANVLGVTITQVDPRDPYVYPSYLYSPYTSDGEAPRRNRLASLLSR